MTQDQLAKILARHRDWLADNTKGCRAYLARVNLAGANLAGADFAHANLAGADLAGANLAGANLTHADLTHANLAGANLAGAYLVRANLTHADLTHADLAGADLAGSDLARVNLAGADLAGANLAGADFAHANLAGANFTDTDLASAKEQLMIPAVPNLDAAILAAIEAGGTLDMSTWHRCKTTHCRAGWAIHLAGEAGYALEKKIGSQIAGAMIYRESRPGKPAPWFFASDDDALADIRACAAES